MINKKQYIFLSLYLTRSLFFGGALAVLLGISKNCLLISGILGTILGCVILYLFYKKNGINKYLRMAIAIICLFIMVLSNTTLTSNYLLYETPLILIVALFLFPVMFGSFKKIEVTSRVGEMVFPVSVLLILFSYIALWYLVDIKNLFPIFNTSVIDFLKGTFIFMVASLLPNLLMLKYKEDLSFKEVSCGYVMGSIVIIIYMFFILTIYGNEFASILRFPEYLILKKIDIFNYISNVENIFVLEWLCNLVIGALFCAKELFNDTSIKGFISIIGVVMGILMLVLSNNFYIVIFIKKYIYYVCGLLIGVAYFKKNKTATA